MYDEALSYLNEPSELKARLPIAYVAEQAGLVLYSGGATIHALCPWHNDSSPSFDIFQYGDFQRFGCWACGISGDVFDFMRRMWPALGFRDSVDAAKRALAKMEAEGWKGPQLRDPLGWDEEAALHLLQSASADPAPIQRLIDAKGWRLEAEWLIARWGLRSRGSEILCPYMGIDGTLAALKHRPATGTRPWLSLPGSQLRGMFFGEAIEPTGAPVLLCEGESDTFHADRWMDEYDVLGLPAGVGATPAGLNKLAGRLVVLAFDGDGAGRLGRERWREALRSVGCTVQYMDIPEGKDLTEVLTCS